MNKEETIARMMDYLYDEMNPQEKKEFEEVLNQNPGLKNEFEEFKKTRSLLNLAPEPESHQRPSVLKILTERSGEEEKSYINNGMKVIFSAAAAILVILFGAAFAGLEIRSDSEGFSVRFGGEEQAEEVVAEEAQPSANAVSEEDLYRFAEEIKAENSVLVSSLLSELQDNQRRQLEEAMQVLSTYYEQQRQEDLDIIVEGMSRIQVETAYKFLQTDETIENIIYALNNQ